MTTLDYVAVLLVVICAGYALYSFGYEAGWRDAERAALQAITDFGAALRGRE